MVTPTHGREDRLRRLLARFKAQTHRDRELLILDDSRDPSPFFTALRDPEVRYLHDPERRSIGAKRNLLAAESTGDLIVHFDDDDHYAPAYLTRIAELQGSADFFTLSAWFAWHELSRGLYYWDTARVDGVHFRVGRALEGLLQREPQGDVAHPSIDENLWGYGFSYSYRRALWEKVRFDDVSFGEDYRFASKAAAAGFSRASAPDEEGLVLHVLHGANSSRIFPQYRLPEAFATKIFGPWIARLLVQQ